MDGLERSKIMFKNALWSTSIKGGQILTNFFLVRILLDLLGEYEYGLWITISSVLSWLSLVNIGLGHGMRNKVVEALAQNQEDKAKIYISTTYALLSIICSVVLLFGVLFFFFDLNWNSFFNVDRTISSRIDLVVLLVFISVILQFILGLIKSVLSAIHKVALSDGIVFLSQLLITGIIFFLSFYSNISLLEVALCYSVSPILVLLISSFWIYKKFPNLAPNLKAVDFKYSKFLFDLGLQFFILQIAAIILFTTDNYIISKFFTPADVTPYSIAFRYFSLISVGFTTFAAPFWSGTTDAYVKKDYDWIKKSILKLVFLWGLSCIVVLVMIFYSAEVYELWLGKKIDIAFTLSISFGVYALVNSWNGIFSSIINGIGKLKLSYRIAIFGSIVNIPLSIFLSKNMGWGIQGVAWATIFCQLIASILIPMQCYYLLKEDKKV
jgi:O-antigen/teichoic acid export membrane protein